jgi:hypothetical protein
MKDNERVERGVVELNLRRDPDPVYRDVSERRFYDLITRPPSLSMLLLSSKGFH